jgi:predicted nucleic acid-binding protein
MIWDHVEASNSLASLLRDAKAEGKVRVLRSHIQLDQNEGIQDKDRLNRILALREEFEEVQVPTSITLLGTSRLGESKLASNLATEKLTSLVNMNIANLKNKKDAILAVTAFEHGAILVTEDITLRKRAIRESVDTWNLYELIQCLKTSAS